MTPFYPRFGVLGFAALLIGCPRVARPGDSSTGPGDAALADSIERDEPVGTLCPTDDFPEAGYPVLCDLIQQDNCAAFWQQFIDAGVAVSACVISSRCARASRCAGPLPRTCFCGDEPECGSGRVCVIDTPDARPYCRCVTR